MQTPKTPVPEETPVAEQDTDFNQRNGQRHDEDARQSIFSGVYESTDWEDLYYRHI
jgi:hypothetical protein